MPVRTDPTRRADGRLAGREAEPPTERVVLTRRATLLAAVPAVLLLLLLGSQVGLLAEQRRLIANQLELQRALTERSVPVLDAARPLVEDLGEDRRDLLARARRADRLVRETTPLVRETTPLVRDLRAARLPEAAEATRDLASAALTGDRLARALDATLAALSEERRLDLARDADRAAELTPTLVELQRQALDVQRQTLTIQREALERIRSLDNKTGGSAPGALPTGVR